MNARTAFRGQSFSGFSPLRRPKINGLGGEGIQGKTLISSKWEDRLSHGNFDQGVQRVEAIIKAIPGTSAHARDATVQKAHQMLNRARPVGWNSPFFAIDYFYNFSKMPYWSAPLSQQDNILPYYGPAMMKKSVFAMAHPEEFGRLHKFLLTQLMPGWDTVPFYKGTASTRSVQRMWESPEWEDLSRTITHGAESLLGFSAPVVHEMLRSVERGETKDHMEMTFSRILWEVSYDDYVEGIRASVKAVRASLASLPPTKTSDTGF